jgi:hypothetical protein
MRPLSASLQLWGVRGLVTALGGAFIGTAQEPVRVFTSAV